MGAISLKNITLGITAVVGTAVILLIDHGEDLVQPFVFLVGLLIVIKINLEYYLDLPMGVTYPIAMLLEIKKRKMVLVASWLILAFMLYGAIVW